MDIFQIIKTVKFVLANVRIVNSQQQIVIWVWPPPKTTIKLIFPQRCKNAHEPNLVHQHCAPQPCAGAMASTRHGWICECMYSCTILDTNYNK